MRSRCGGRPGPRGLEVGPYPVALGRQQQVLQEVAPTARGPDGDPLQDEPVQPLVADAVQYGDGVGALGAVRVEQDADQSVHRVLDSGALVAVQDEREMRGSGPAGDGATQSAPQPLVEVGAELGPQRALGRLAEGQSDERVVPELRVLVERGGEPPFGEDHRQRVGDVLGAVLGQLLADPGQLIGWPGRLGSGPGRPTRAWRRRCAGSRCGVWSASPPAPFPAAGVAARAPRGRTGRRPASYRARGRRGREGPVGCPPATALPSTRPRDQGERGCRDRRGRRGRGRDAGRAADRAGRTTSRGRSR